MVAIDFHDREYYGDKNDVWIVGGKYKNGTCWFHRYATIEIISRRKRISVFALPIHVFLNSHKEIVVKTLIERVLKYVKKIELVLLDRGFFSSAVINTIEGMGLKFLMPAVNNPKIKYIRKTVYGFKMGESRFNLIVKGNGKKKRKWATNLEDVPEKLERIYSRRWRIETGYRTKKKFRITTTTRNPVIRFLFFVIELLLYNFWVMCNVIPSLVREIVDGIKRVMTRILKIRV